jgi:hypothetical protein
MTGACAPPLAERGDVCERHSYFFNYPACAAHGASMSGSNAAGATRGERNRLLVLAGGAGTVLLAIMGLAALFGHWHSLLRDAESPALGAAVLQLVTILVCLCGHLSPSSSGTARRRYGGLLMLAIMAGSELPRAAAVAPHLDVSVDDMVGDVATWVQQSQQEPSPQSSRKALDNHTYRTSDPVAAGLLPKGAEPDAAVLEERAAARMLLQWPSGVTTADQSPGPDPAFLHEEKKLKDMSKRLDAGLERCVDECSLLHYFLSCCSKF